MSRKSTALFSRSILPVGVSMGNKCILSLSCKTARHCNTSLLQGLYAVVAKCFVFTLIIMDPWPLLEPARLKTSVNRLGVTKSSLGKVK